MLKIRCKNCNAILESHQSKTRCCGCDNLTTVKGETITALDLSLVELITTNQVKKQKSCFSKEELVYQEERRNRKVRKIEFEIR